MTSTGDRFAPVQAKAALIDPESLTVLWMNESAAQDLADGGASFSPGTPLSQAVPLAEVLGVPAALVEVADTGVARHLSTSLVSTAKGSLVIVASIYRLPDGNLLLLMDRTFVAEREKPAGRGTQDGV